MTSLNSHQAKWHSPSEVVDILVSLGICTSIASAYNIVWVLDGYLSEYIFWNEISGKAESNQRTYAEKVTGQIFVHQTCYQATVALRLW